MKKILISLGVIVCLFGLLVFFTTKHNKEKSQDNAYQKDTLNPATIEQIDDPLYQNQIVPKELKEELNSKEDVFVYFYSPTCNVCKEVSPILVPVAKKMNIDLKKFNLLEFETGYANFNIKYTPTVIHYKNGEELDRLVGYNSKKQLKDWLKDNL
ncbi:thioredoxin family protein [Priestia endophytica]|uniref:thioredoxin family protein n=1 Tax=Priestia endophytica TaxID=135735 RepID=UPI000F53DD56|nr:thioredoxin family protein [Priestia endophytica]RPK04734.1 hypothetical protein FH5_01972 [Priestia endophytica]